MELRLLRHGLRTSIVNNASAYGYSVAITLSFVATQRSLGRPAGGEILLLAVGAALGFAVIEAVAVGTVRGKVPTDPSDVVVLRAPSP